MKVITIGREVDNDVVIDDGYASRHHLQIVQSDNGVYKLADFGSSNGTYVNGQRVKGEIVLEPNDVVRIGNTTIPWRMYFEQVQSEARTKLDETPFVPPSPVKTNTRATLRVFREKKIAGMAIKFFVFVDGKKIGDLKSGVMLTCELDKGLHKLKITSFEKDISQEINISEGCNVVEVKVSIGLGFLVGRPHIDNIRYM